MAAENSNPKINRPPINKAILLHNITCSYCGAVLTGQSSTKEHVIGRRFVPKGKLAGQWNLILNACIICNNLKSDLEDDLSAISMQPDAYGQHSVNDPILIEQAKKKGTGSTSRLTNKPVADSNEQIVINSTIFPGVSMAFSLSAPPQAAPARIYQLAEFHLKAFFYLISYNKETNIGGFWLGQYWPVMFSKRADWGNSIQVAFMNAVKEWPLRLHAIGADAYFKIIIRRHPNAECWSWALEWNQSHRVIGFFGDPESIQQVLDSFPSLNSIEFPTGTGGDSAYRFRHEVPLDKSNDLLFEWYNSQ